MGLLAEERNSSDTWHRIAFSRFAEQARAPHDDDPALAHAESVPTAVHRSLLSNDDISAVLSAVERLEAEYAPQMLRCQGAKMYEPVGSNRLHQSLVQIVRASTDSSRVSATLWAAGMVQATQRCTYITMAGLSARYRRCTSDWCG